MSKLISFKKFSKKASKINYLANTSVVMDNKVPVGFVFGRDSFISFLQHIDDEFEKKVKDPKKAFNNPAGRLIDLIEERLPLNPRFVKDLKSSILRDKKSKTISLGKLVRALNV